MMSIDRLSHVALPLLSVGVTMLLWQLIVSVNQIEAFVLPAPADVLTAFEIGLIEGRLYPHIWFTLRATMIGLALGCGVAILLGIVLAEFRTLNQFFFPVLIGLQSIPLVAIAPIIIVWFGIGIASKIFMVAQLCFFPTFVSTVIGLTLAKPELLDLYRTFSASRWHVLLNVKLPSAANHIFGGLQIAVVQSFIGCVVAEFIASKEGLGFLIKALSSQLDLSMMFAAIITLSVMGAAAGLLTNSLHRRIVFWEGPARAKTATAP
jgi:NitT/TauT family transport system permease protein